MGVQTVLPKPHSALLLAMALVLAACAAPQALPGVPQAALVAPTDRSVNLTVGQTRALPLNAGGAPASPADVTWTSSDPSVVSVDLAGNVTAVGVGSAGVRARLRASPDVSVLYALSVTAAPGAGGSYEHRVLDLINQARAQGRSCGDKAFGASSALSWNTALGSASAAYSRDMEVRGFFGHVSPEGRTLGDRLQAAGAGDLKQQAETIAGGQPTPEAVVLNWLSSPTHCAALLNPAFTELGVGYARGGAYQHYWTAIFASR